MAQTVVLPQKNTLGDSFPKLLQMLMMNSIRQNRFERNLELKEKLEERLQDRKQAIDDELAEKERKHDLARERIRAEREQAERNDDIRKATELKGLEGNIALQKEAAKRTAAAKKVQLERDFKLSERKAKEAQQKKTDIAGLMKAGLSRRTADPQMGPSGPIDAPLDPGTQRGPYGNIWENKPRSRQFLRGKDAYHEALPGPGGEIRKTNIAPPPKGNLAQDISSAFYNALGVGGTQTGGTPPAQTTPPLATPGAKGPLSKRRYSITPPAQTTPPLATPGAKGPLSKVMAQYYLDIAAIQHPDIKSIKVLKEFAKELAREAGYQ